jgi:glutathione synthase/RimK-type ligase-like ATP-grasp enzyme
VDAVPNQTSPITTTVDAIAEAIRAAGYTAMAQEFVAKPEYRGRIIVAMTRNIARDQRLGPDVARRFRQLTAAAGHFA